MFVCCCISIYEKKKKSKSCTCENFLAASQMNVFGTEICDQFCEETELQRADRLYLKVAATFFQHSHAHAHCRMEDFRTFYHQIGLRT